MECFPHRIKQPIPKLFTISLTDQIVPTKMSFDKKIKKSRFDFLKFAAVSGEQDKY